jgi:glycosyltransferase involved in cell wall biosynthesis
MDLTIGFDATPLLGQRSGVGHYTGRLLAALIEAYPETHYRLYSNRPLNGLEAALDGAERVPAYLERSRWLWMQTALPRELRRRPPDLLHFTNALAPLYTEQPFILSIHDASLFLLRRYHPRARLLAMRWLLPAAARRAAAVVTISQSARADLCRVLNLPADKVHVVHLAAPADFQPVTDPARLEAVRRRYGLPEEFLLYVGTLEPRKNLVRVVHALGALRRDGLSPHLLLAGPEGWSMEGFGREVEHAGMKGAVHRLGYVPVEDLPVLYSLARLFVFPSLYEGFGLPPLEAMACGTPVLTSNSSSLAEIGGDAAWLVDPLDEAGLAHAIRQIWCDDELRRELGRRGRERARAFSWLETARQTMALYQSTLAT